MDLPSWPDGTVAILATRSGAIPVSTGVRLASDRLAFGLSVKRDSLKALIDDPQIAFAVLAEGLAFTAHGRAHVVDPLPGLDGMVGVVLEVERVQDHTNRHFAMDSGVGWHWTDDESVERDRQVRAAVGGLS